MSRIASAGVGGLLGHKVFESFGLLFSLERFLFRFARWLDSKRLLLLSVHVTLWRQQQYDQCDQLEEELEAAQSKRRCEPHGQHPDQVRHRARLTFQGVF